MIYSFDVSTPANTAEADKQRTDVKITSGIIHQIDIVFPPGCAGLAYIAINDGQNQVWPTNPDEFFHVNGETISFKEFYHVRSAPRILTVWTFNLDETFSHSIIVRLGILKASEIQGVWLPWTEEVIE